MFCPGCGTEERLRSQFCRTCGNDLRMARTGLERPGSITESAVTAREEIGRSIALKIREVQSGKDLQQIAERVLPQITEFLRSPEEMRLSRVREGMVAASAGISATILFVVVSMVSGNEKFLIAAAGGLVPFFIGISILLSGLYFTIPKDRYPDSNSSESDLNVITGNTAQTARELADPAQPPEALSVTEHTTHHLSQT
jgi:hypothetical protein